MGRTGKWGLGILLAAAAAGAGVIGLLRSEEKKPPDPTAGDSALDPITDYDRVETAQSAAGKFLKKAISAPLLKLDVEGIRPFLAADFRARFPALSEGRRLDENGLVITDFAGANAPETDAAGFLSRLKPLVDRYSTITRSQFRCFTFLIDKSETRARGLYHWWLSGRGPEGRRLEVQGDFEVDFSGRPDDWKISRVGFPAGALVESSRAAFADITDATGFEFAYSAEGRAAVQAVIDNRTMTNAGSIGVVDWNRDGFPDLLAANENRRAVVFVNDGQGGFLPRELPEQGAPFYLHLDLDGDGVEELVSSRPAWYRRDRACLGLYVRKGDAWEFREALVFENPPSIREIVCYHIAAGDVNGDGRLDLYVTAYSDSRSGALEFSFLNAQSGARDLLFINKGGLAFTEEARERGIDDRRYGYVSEFFDFDRDGDLDLLVVNDFASNLYYTNRGGGTFSDTPDHPLVRNPAFGMGLSIADFDNEGDYRVYVSNMYSHAGNRMTAVSRNLTEENRRKVLFSAQGNALFEPGDGWKETGIARGVARADWAWGSVFFDLENDGDKDIFVANGFTTHSDPAAPDY